MYLILSMTFLWQIHHVGCRIQIRIQRYTKIYEDDTLTWSVITKNGIVSFRKYTIIELFKTRLGQNVLIFEVAKNDDSIVWVLSEKCERKVWCDFALSIFFLSVDNNTGQWSTFGSHEGVVTIDLVRQKTMIVMKTNPKWYRTSPKSIF